MASSRSSRTWSPGAPAHAAAADARQMSLRSASARSNRIGRAKSSTSLTMRFRRVVSSSMSATASRHSDAVAVSRRRIGSDDLMIISGLRISCAMMVDRRPSADSRSFCAASFWNLPIDSVIVLNVEASSRASSSSHGRLLSDDPPRQVAGGRHFAHGAGDGVERPRHRARNAVAHQRRHDHGQREGARRGRCGWCSGSEGARCGSAGSARRARPAPQRGRHRCRRAAA